MQREEIERDRHGLGAAQLDSPRAGNSADSNLLATMAGTRAVHCSRLRRVLRLLKLQRSCGVDWLLLQRRSLLGERPTLRLLHRLRPSSLSRVVVHQTVWPQDDRDRRRQCLRSWVLAEGRWHG